MKNEVSGRKKIIEEEEIRKGGRRQESKGCEEQRVSSKAANHPVHYKKILES